MFVNAIISFAINSSKQKLLLLFSILLLIISCIDINFKDTFIHVSAPNYLRIGSVICFFTFILILFFEAYFQEKRKILNKNLKFNNTTISFKVENIESINDYSQSSAFILPITTNLSDDCLISSKSAAGAFFLQHHTCRIKRFTSMFTGKFIEKGNVFTLPDEFNIPAKIILVATSEFKNKRITDPATIFTSLRNMLHEATAYKLDHLYLPIIGSGHGGMNLTEALNLLIICFHFLSKEFPERRKITFCIRKEDINDIKQTFLYSYH